MLELKDYGIAFGTRERALEILESGCVDGEVSFYGVVAASPSFIDELLRGLDERFEDVTVTMPDAENESLCQLLVRQMMRISGGVEPGLKA